ncbi:hypothetical protein ACLOJK_011861 [Asimina triloba]
MRAPSLLVQCLLGLLPHDKTYDGIYTFSERDLHLPSPAVEILPSKTAHPCKYAGENADSGLSIFKFDAKDPGKPRLVNCDAKFSPGRVSVADLIQRSDLMPSKLEGLKCWDGCSLDLLNVLKHEICDGQLSFRGKRVLELRCSSGLPGIFACLKDLNAETMRCTTMPNVLANLDQVHEQQCQQPEGPLTPSRLLFAPDVHFYAGHWEELHTILSVVQKDGLDLTHGFSQCLSEEDFTDGCSSQDDSIIGQESSYRRSRKFSGSRAWESASETDQSEGGYDVILMADIPCSVTSLKKLYALIKKCLRPPYGVLYLGAKKHYVSSVGGARHLRHVVDEEGIFGAHIVSDTGDREIWKFFLK